MSVCKKELGVWAKRGAAAVALMLSLASCASPDSAEPRMTEFFDDLLSPSQAQTESVASSDQIAPADASALLDPGRRASYIIEGEANRFASGFYRDDQEEDPSEVYSFRFVDAPLEDVVEAILGQALGVTYAIDPSVSGRLSLSTSEPVKRTVLLETLADILSLSGIALVQVGEVYRVQPSNAPTSEAARRLGSLAGAATEIVPLRYVQGSEIVQALDSMNEINVIARPIPGKNVVTLTGSRQDVLHALDLIDAFDTHALEGMSFGLFYLEKAPVGDVVEELTQIFGVRGSGLRFIPVERLNGFFAFAPDVETLQEVRRWQRRLDQTVTSAGARIFVHPVRHRRSGEMVEILNTLYRNRDSGQASAIPASNLSTDQVSASSRIVDDEANNSILFYGTAAEFDLVKSTITQLDVLPHQVLIEAAVVEVSLDDDLRYGVQWLFESGDFQARLSNATTGAIAGTFPGFAATVEASNINAVLSALDSITSINVVSSPRMLVESGKTAALQVGDEVPIATQTATSTTSADAPTVNTIQYRDTGIILAVTPQVNEGGFVKLHIVQEISDVTTTVTSDLDSPTIQQRRFESFVSVEDGSTIALGGLIREKSEVKRSGVPLASDIPVLGNLFSTTSDAFERSELIVLLTPRVVRTSEDMRGLTNDLKAAMRETFGGEE